MDGDTSYPFETNLVGAYNCLELARRDSAQFVFLSTSRVYPYPTLGELALRRGRDPLRARARAAGRRASPRPASPRRSRSTAPRTLYGATKLAAELLVAEYAANFGLPTVVNRCGVIAGPWQMGKVDQGVFTFWLLHHHFGRPLSYIGYGGDGQAGARPAARRRPGRAGRPAAGRPRALGRLRRQRRRRPRGQPLAARDDRDLPRADRQRGRRSAPRAPSGPATFRYTSPTARACSGAPNGDPRKSPREVLADILAWVEENDDVVGVAGACDEALRRDPRPQRGRVDRGDAAATIGRLDAAGIEHEILVVDDASVDGTAVAGRGDRRRASAGALHALAPPARLRVHGPLGARALRRRRGRGDDGRRLRRPRRPGPLPRAARAGLRLRLRLALRQRRPRLRLPAGEADAQPARQLVHPGRSSATASTTRRTPSRPTGAR